MTMNNQSSNSIGLTISNGIDGGQRQGIHIQATSKCDCWNIKSFGKDLTLDGKSQKVQY